MISVEEALEQILSYIPVLDAEEKPILDCLGQVLAEDVYSSLDIPPLDNSAMDGYAVVARSTQGASPATPQILRVIGEVAAGYIGPWEVTPGNAVRIMTGAPIPNGADSVVQFEDTDEEIRRATKGSLEEIGVLGEIPLGLNIRRAGEDIRRGQLVLMGGTVLRPAQIGVLASLGWAKAKVIRRPLVAILATGDELVAVGQPLPPGKIYNSNSYTLSAQVLRYGGIPKSLGIARDQMEELVARINEGLDADLLITSAGVSLGDYDIVKDVLARLGEIAFWTVRMKPGKPLAFGVLGERRLPHIGLPGNPVSSMIAFEQFARPAILKMLGKSNLAKPTIEAIIQEPVKNTDGRRIFARAAVVKEGDHYIARLTGPQGSGILTSMARANGLVVIPEEVASVKAGDRVKVQMLDWDEALF